MKAAKGVILSIIGTLVILTGCKTTKQGLHAVPADIKQAIIENLDSAQYYVLENFELLNDSSTKDFSFDKNGNVIRERKNSKHELLVKSGTRAVYISSDFTDTSWVRDVEVAKTAKKDYFTETSAGGLIRLKIDPNWPELTFKQMRFAKVLRKDQDQKPIITTVTAYVLVVDTVIQNHVKVLRTPYGNPEDGTSFRVVAKKLPYVAVSPKDIWRKSTKVKIAKGMKVGSKPTEDQ